MVWVDLGRVVWTTAVATWATDPLSHSAMVSTRRPMTPKRARDLIGRARDAALGSAATLADKASVLSQETTAYVQGADERAHQWYQDAREALPGQDDGALHGVGDALGHGGIKFDEQDRLPWLESDDDEEYEGIDNKRVAVAVLGGLALTAAAVGGFWYFTHRSDNSVPVADGSVVAAPAESYKEAPKDPGGKQFAGTGDSSFAVSQGRNVPRNWPAAMPKPPGPMRPRSPHQRRRRQAPVLPVARRWRPSPKRRLRPSRGCAQSGGCRKRPGRRRGPDRGLYQRKRGGGRVEPIGAGA
jgi:hypothetical protein